MSLTEIGLGILEVSIIKKNNLELGRNSVKKEVGRTKE